MKILGVYDTKYYEQCVGVFTYKELAEYFDTTIENIRCNVCKGTKRDSRYRIEVLYETNYTSDIERQRRLQRERYLRKRRK